MFSVSSDKYIQPSPIKKFSNNKLVFFIIAGKAHQREIHIPPLTSRTVFCHTKNGKKRNHGRAYPSTLPSHIVPILSHVTPPHAATDVPPPTRNLSSSAKIVDKAMPCRDLRSMCLHTKGQKWALVFATPSWKHIQTGVRSTSLAGIEIHIPQPLQCLILWSSPAQTTSLTQTSLLSRQAVKR